MAEDKKTPGDEDHLESAEIIEEAQLDSPGSRAEGSPAAEVSDLADIETRLQQALAKVEECKDQEIRARAEIQNARRRAEKDVENAHKYALEKMAKELLPVVDNLERGLEAVPAEKLEDAEFNSMKEGVELTLSLFISALTRFKIEQVDPAGEPFDPQLHQAITVVEQDSVEPNTVVNVMQKGYTLHGRLLRPAMVVVSRASASAAPKIDEQA